MVKGPKKLDALFHDTLKDIYFAERKILSALAKAAQSEEHKAWFEKHGGEKGQIEWLEWLEDCEIICYARALLGSSARSVQLSFRRT